MREKSRVLCFLFENSAKTFLTCMLYEWYNGDRLKKSANKLRKIDFYYYKE